MQTRAKGACSIMKRWTISAREGHACPVPGYAESVARGADSASMHRLLHAAAMELVSMGTSSRPAFEVAVDYISHAKEAISVMVVSDPSQASNLGVDAAQGVENNQQVDPSVVAPPRVRSRGRPKELRYKSPIESPGASKRQAVANLKGGKQGDTPRRSTRFLRTGVIIVEHCVTCGSTQHRSCSFENHSVEEPAEVTRRRCK